MEARPGIRKPVPRVRIPLPAPPDRGPAPPSDLTTFSPTSRARSASANPQRPLSLSNTWREVMKPFFSVAQALWVACDSRVMRA